MFVKLLKKVVFSVSSNELEVSYYMYTERFSQGVTSSLMFYPGT